jgi:hypothetical protein
MLCGRTPDKKIGYSIAQQRSPANRRGFLLSPSKSSYAFDTFLARPKLSRKSEAYT